MKTLFTSLIFIISLHLIISTSTFAQTGDCVSQRYHDRVFEQIKVTKDIEFATVYNVTDPLELFPVNLKLDFYEPAPTEEYLEERPLVIMLFGGAFVTGDKDDADMMAWCDSLAHYGYACAAVQYRLDNLANMGVSSAATVRAAYRAIQDARAAIRFLLEDPNGFGFFIDRDYIYTGGESAGAITAIHTAYMEESERPGDTYGDAFSSDLGCLDCSGNDYDQPFDVKGIIDLWGGTLTLDMIDQTENIPMCIIHGTADDIVLYDTGRPFLNFYPTFPVLFGALPMHNHMSSLGIYHEFYPYDGEGHVFYGIPSGIVTFPNDLWDPVWNQGRNFLSTIIVHDSPQPIGTMDVCWGDEETYSVPSELGSTYCWTIENGTIINSNNNEVTVAWDVAAGTGTLTVVEENNIDVIGEPASMDVNINALPAVDFSYTNNDFDFTFTDNTTGSVDWMWNFGDGGTSMDAMPTHTYSENGDFPTTLTVTDGNGCINSATETTSVAVCKPPTNIVTSFMTIQEEVRIKVAWTHADDFYRYQFRYRPVGSTTWNTTGSTPGRDFLTIGGLTEDVTYQFQMRTWCNIGVWSAWNYAEMGTFVFSPCFYPENVAVTMENPETVKLRIAWDVEPDATKYQVKYKDLNGGDWIQTGTPYPYKVLTGLNPNTVYNFRVRSFCGEFWGTYSPAVYFNTSTGTARLADEFEELEFEIYPNPAKDILNVNFRLSEFSKATLSISDMLGREIKTLNNSYDGMNNQQMDISDLEEGTYFIRIRTSGGISEIRKFVKY